MSSKTRFAVILCSAPVIAFAIVGGLLGKAIAREDTYQHLRVFEDVVALILNNYVEEVDVDKVMRGAMHGLADGLDPDSAYLTAANVRMIEKGEPPPQADIGVELTRQFWLRVIAARDNSPAARAGLRPGDYIRAIDGKPTRDLSVFEGTRLLRGAQGSRVKLTVIRGNAADPHELELTRESPGAATCSGRIAAPGIGYVRLTAFEAGTVTKLAARIAELKSAGADRLILDLRRTASGALEAGVEAARLFVGRGTLAIREAHGGERETIASGTGDGTMTLPVVVLIDAGTSGAAELFASALRDNKRADLIGEKTHGRAALQELIKLPDGSGLWMSTIRYLTPAGAPLHEKGLQPTVEVEEPDVEFGAPAPTSDPILDKALERLALQAAA